MHCGHPALVFGQFKLWVGAGQDCFCRLEETIGFVSGDAASAEVQQLKRRAGFPDRPDMQDWRIVQRGKLLEVTFDLFVIALRDGGDPVAIACAV